MIRHKSQMNKEERLAAGFIKQALGTIPKMVDTCQHIDDDKTKLLVKKLAYNMSKLLIEDGFGYEQEEVDSYWGL